MNRKQFLSKLVGASAVLTVAPNVLAEKKPYVKPEAIEVDLSRIPDGMTLEQFIKIWKETNGMLVYRDSPRRTGGVIPFIAKHQRLKAPTMPWTWNTES